jgi:putative ABC transport system substrate-binding protein
VSFTTTTPLALAVRSAAPSMPLLFGIGGDPVAVGLVASLAQPGGNATGWTFASHLSSVRMLSLLKEVLPRALRIGIVFTRGNAASQQFLQALTASADAARVSLKAFPVASKQDIHALDPAWLKEPLDGLIVPFDVITGAHLGDIVRLAALHRLPAIYGVRYFVDAGGLMSYGASWPVELKRTADFVARILDGVKPADLPAHTAQNFELLVNQRAARALGIGIPSSVLAQATEVIE